MKERWKQHLKFRENVSFRLWCWKIVLSQRMFSAINRKHKTLSSHAIGVSLRSPLMWGCRRGALGWFGGRTCANLSPVSLGSSTWLWEWRALPWEGQRRKIWPESVVTLLHPWDVGKVYLTWEVTWISSATGKSYRREGLGDLRVKSKLYSFSWDWELSRQPNSSFFLQKLVISLVSFLRAVSLGAVPC